MEHIEFLVDECLGLLNIAKICLNEEIYSQIISAQLEAPSEYHHQTFVERL